jgi:hypothetical protein
MFSFSSVDRKGLFSSGAEKSSRAEKSLIQKVGKFSSPVGAEGSLSSGAERYLLQVVGEVSSTAERFPLYWRWNDLLISGKERSWWQRDKKKSYAVERKDFLSNKGKVS